MWVAHEVRVHFGSERKKEGYDVGKPFGIHELLRLVAKVDEDACQNPGQENKRFILWLGAKSCPGLLRHEGGSKMPGRASALLLTHGFIMERNIAGLFPGHRLNFHLNTRFNPSSGGRRCVPSEDRCLEVR